MLLSFLSTCPLTDSSECTTCPLAGSSESTTSYSFCWIFVKPVHIIDHEGELCEGCICFLHLTLFQSYGPFYGLYRLAYQRFFCFLLNSCYKYIAYHLNKLCITGGRGRFYYRENKEFWIHRQGMHFIIRLWYKSADDCIHFYLYPIDMKGFCSCGFCFLCTNH